MNAVISLNPARSAPIGRLKPSRGATREEGRHRDFVVDKAVEFADLLARILLH